MNVSSELRPLIARAVPPAVKRWLRRALLWKKRSQFRPYVLNRSVQGELIPTYIADATGQDWYGRAEVISPELPFIRDHMISASDLVFDVGSHHGFYAAYMARRAARLVAIEPNPYNLPFLRKNIELNHLQNVIVRQAAVGDSIGKVSLLQESDWGGIECSDTGALPTVDVDLLTLDQLAAEYGFPQLVKIDVEGFEGSALRGASQILQRRPKIALEVHVEWACRYGSSVQEILDLLHLESYRVWVLRHKSLEVQPWSGEDLTAMPAPKFHLFLVPVNAFDRMGSTAHTPKPHIEAEG